MMLSEVIAVPELELNLEPGAHTRLWFVEVSDLATGERCTLPPAVEWHQALHLMNELAAIYGRESVSLYQWDIMRIATFL